MQFALWLLQAAPDAAAGTDNTNTIRIVAGVLAILCVVVILVRRKKKAAKDDWN